MGQYREPPDWLAWLCCAGCVCGIVAAGVWLLPLDRYIGSTMWSLIVAGFAVVGGIPWGLAAARWFWNR